MHVDGNLGSELHYEPNSLGQCYGSNVAKYATSLPRGLSPYKNKKYRTKNVSKLHFVVLYFFVFAL